MPKNHLINVGIVLLGAFLSFQEIKYISWIGIGIICFGTLLAIYLDNKE